MSEKADELRDAVMNAILIFKELLSQFAGRNSGARRSVAFVHAPRRARAGNQASEGH